MTSVDIPEPTTVSPMFIPPLTLSTVTDVNGVRLSAATSQIAAEPNTVDISIVSMTFTGIPSDSLYNKSIDVIFKESFSS